MILTRSPMRVSFFGGGSDILEHYAKWGGNVVSAAIDKYIYVAVNKTPHKHIKLSYSKQELVTDVNDIQNEIVKNALKYFGINSGIDISTFADIPTVGTGLGGSSAFTCALVNALMALDYQQDKIYYNDFTIAETAADIEINHCGWKIGKQDQYASAFGGMNHFGFREDGRVLVKKINPGDIQEHMLLIPTNLQRHASDILGNIDFNAKSTVVRQLSRIAISESEYIPNIYKYGEALNTCWELKKQMSGEISNDKIDNMYQLCMDNGALGCKLLGAGGGGYMLVLAEKENKIENLFPDRVCLRPKISQSGTTILYNDERR